MKELTWLEGNRIQIEPPKKTKKVTGTRHRYYPRSESVVYRI